jgi:RNA polymerase sigma factor (sigma-70 family)
MIIDVDPIQRVAVPPNAVMSNLKNGVNHTASDLFITQDTLLEIKLDGENNDILATWREEIIDSPNPLDSDPSTDIEELYFGEVNQYSLLTEEQTIELGKQIELGKAAKATLDKETVEEVKRQELVEAARLGDAACQQLFNANLRLVAFMAHRYSGRGVALMDLIQEGNIALYNSTETYDYRLGPFGSYASWGIRHVFFRTIANQARINRLPEYIIEKIGSLEKVSRQLAQQLGREPTDAEIGEQVGMAANKVKETLLLASREPDSIDSPIDEDEDFTLSDIIADNDALTLSDINEANTLPVLLDEALRTHLSNLQADVLRWRYGLIDGQIKDPVEIGKALGISSNKARVMEREAMRKLLATPAFRSTFYDFIDHDHKSEEQF